MRTPVGASCRAASSIRKSSARRTAKGCSPRRARLGRGTAWPRPNCSAWRTKCTPRRGAGYQHHGRLRHHAPLHERGLEFGICVEVVFDGALVVAGHENECVDPRLNGLLGGVLNEGLVDDGRSSLGIALVAGRKRVLLATGKTAFLTFVIFYSHLKRCNISDTSDQIFDPSIKIVFGLKPVKR